MSIQIIGSNDNDRLYCVGSLTKLLTTFVCLSLLAEKYALNDILDDNTFLDKICVNQASCDFLHLFQKIIGSKFSIRDICTYYTGLPYTFDVSAQEIENVDAGNPFKHHSIPDEKTFLSMCQNNITLVYPNESKFHYSELSIIFLGYLIEKIYDIQIESLFLKYIIEPFQLKNSLFSRTLVANAYQQDLSDQYDYPAIAVQNHGYFCYSNGFYTTLNDEKKLLEGMLTTNVFTYMVDVKHARAASNRLLNGLTIEIRLKDDDVMFGYEGLSFSGCNIWAYSMKQKQGYLTFTNSEEDAYPIIYDNFGYTDFDKVPDASQQIYKKFLANYRFNDQNKDIPLEYQGNYHRVKINAFSLADVFTVGHDFIQIRNPEAVKYEVIYVNQHYCIKNKDNVHGSKVGFYQAKSGNKYMYFDGNLYQKS